MVPETCGRISDPEERRVHPAEVEQRREIAHLACSCGHATDDAARRAPRATGAAVVELEAEGRELPRAGHYYDRIVDKAGR